MNENTHIIQTPIAQDALSHLRDKNTPTATFRMYADILSKELVRNALFPQDLQEITVSTPITDTKARVLSRSFDAIPILRSGLAMLPSFLEIVKDTRIGFAGLKRDEKTAIAHEYYWNIPRVLENDCIVILDPMIATGGSVRAVITKLREQYSHEIRIVSIVCSPEGINTIRENYKNEHIFTAAIDTSLNAQKYIVPGLGDFGDRYFGTE